MRYFKIKIGYDKSEYVQIDETELEKAIGVFLTDGKGVFKRGVVRGQDIIAIQEDWHKALGINPEWKMTPEDRNELARRGIEREYKGVIPEVTQRVKYLIENNKQNLIGQGVDIPQLEGGAGVLNKERIQLADSKKM